MMPEKKRIELEALLRLKRLERPAPEFWDSFERELRAKQLAALVEKRPWWRDFSARFAGFRRYHLPIGATAILAMTLVVVRDYQPATVDSPVRTASPTERGERLVRDVQPQGAVDAGVSSVVKEELEWGPRSPANDLASALPQEIESPTDASGGHGAAAGSSVLWASGAASDEQLTPSARSIAANLAAAEAAEPAVVRRLLGLRHGFEAGASTLEAAVEPLQQMSSPSEVRLARFDSPMARTALLSSPSRGDERVARDIDVYERAARRIGGGGDRFIVKF